MLKIYKNNRYIPCFIIIVLLITTAYVSNIFFIENEPSISKQVGHELKSKHFDISTPTCKIPLLDPFDPSIILYYNNKTRYKCRNQQQLVISNDTHLIVNLDAFNDYNISKAQLPDCYYQYFWRVEPKLKQIDKKVEYGKEVYFNTTVKMDEEYVKVICKLNKKEIYKDYYAFVIPHFVKKQSSKSNSTRKLNVLIIGLDSVSRLNFHRQMPLTNEFLQNDLEAIEYFGYNKVGDNTFPNLIPVLSGMSIEELTKTCWPTSNSKFDNCTFIWSKYHEAEYVTSFAEEAAWMGLFNYLKVGFIKQPTTHMWGTFDREAESAIGYYGLNSKLCQTVRLTLEYLNEYTLKFVRTYQRAKQSYFGLFWGSSISHDDINYDPRADVLYRDFLRNLALTDVLEDSLLFFMSDHGIRWGKITQTYQGRLEERLPFFFVITPKWFKKQYTEIENNLKENARKLTTPFDLHETLKAIVNGDFSSEPTKPSRGVSLFRPVPVNRTCDSAGIPPHWCTCQESFTLQPYDRLSNLSAEFVINYINNLLHDHTYCAKVKLDAVIDASYSKSVKFDNVKSITFITVVFRTKYVGAIFEATVKCTICDDLKFFTLGGPISRNNLYGHQGDCIKDATLRLYCYCKM